ncbi:hypothetical protein [Amycolatopsis sp. WGS_07]|uniref:hypothetical protein n=1 Tax=Amycolatopsis sp. WGS_07 TaxID=3076764 RepID=UPI0038736620
MNLFRESAGSSQQPDWSGRPGAGDASTQETIYPSEQAQSSAGVSHAEADENELSDALASVEDVSPAAADATAEAVAKAGAAVATSHFNQGENTAIKIINYLQESLERFQADSSYLSTVLKLFARPAGFDSRLDEWKQSHLIVVALDQDSGRFITAQALLASIWQDLGTDVGALAFGGGSTFPVDRLPRHRNWAYIVEVPAEETDLKLSSNFGTSIRELQERLRSQSCWMVLIMSTDQWCRAEPQAPAVTVIRNGRVDPVEIARRALSARDDTIALDRWLGGNGVRHLLVNQPPAEVQEVVELIVAAHQLPESELEERALGAAASSRPSELAQAPRDENSFAKRVGIVEAARLNWRKQLLEWHRDERRTSVERNFLISAAAQPGAPVAHVHVGTADLAVALKEDGAKEASTGQNVPGVIDLVDAANADLGDGDTVTFNRVGWDDAALQYFWVDRPLSRGLFIDWLVARPVRPQDSESLESLSHEQRAALASRIANLAVNWAVRQGRSDPLTAIADKWHENAAVWSEFIDVLDHAAVQPSTARHIHPMLLNWSQAGAAPARPQAVAEICSRQFGSKYTGKALVRLKHAAKSDDVSVIGAVKTAVRKLWDDETVRLALFTAVIKWCKDEKTSAAGRQAFHTLAIAPHPEDARFPWVLNEPADEAGRRPSAEDLVCGWRGLLTPDNSDSVVREVLTFWLDAALVFPTGAVWPAARRRHHRHSRHEQQRLGASSQVVAGPREPPGPATACQRHSVRERNASRVDRVQLALGHQTGEISPSLAAADHPVQGWSAFLIDQPCHGLRTVVRMTAVVPPLIPGAGPAGTLPLPQHARDLIGGDSARLEERPHLR